MMDVSQVLVCVAAAAACTGVSRALPVPLPLLQMTAGALLALVFGLSVQLEPEAFLLVFIPPLLFIDGWRIPKREFRRFRRTILLMAFGLVVISVLGVGLVITWCIPAIPRPVAFALAAALSPTDAVAVAGISGRVRIPPSLMHILQGEALMNDASGLVCLRVAIATIATGAFSWGRAAGSLAVVAIGGLLVGIAVTWLFARAQRIVFGSAEGDPGARIMLILLLPFVAYLAAEHVHCSGILAAAAAGMSLPRFEIVDVGHRTSRRQTNAVVGMVETALNGLVFVLLGLQLPDILDRSRATATAAGLASPMSLVATALLAGASLFLVRFVWVWISMRVTVFTRKSQGRDALVLPLRLVTMTALAGVRGAISLAAALMIPVAATTASGAAYPARDVAVLVTAVVILFSLVSASIGLPLAGKNLELPADTRHIDEEATVRAALAEAALAAVERERTARVDATEAESRGLVEEAAGFVLERYRVKLAEEGGSGSDRGAADHERAFRLVALEAERNCLHALWKDRRIDDVLYRRVLGRLDVAEEAIAPSMMPQPGHHG